MRNSKGETVIVSFIFPIHPKTRGDCPGGTVTLSASESEKVYKLSKNGEEIQIVCPSCGMTATQRVNLSYFNQYK